MTSPPNRPPTRNGQPSTSAQQVDDFRRAQASQPVGPPPGKVKNGGGFNPSVIPTFNVNVTKTTTNGGAPSGAPVGTNGATRQAQGGGFTSNEDIQAYCEHGRKAARNRAVTVALDVAMLEGRLRNIPDQFGSMSGSRARARRVTRWLKRVAQAEKLIAKWYSALYSAFEREYEAELMKIGKGRKQQKPSPRFHWR